MASSTARRPRETDSTWSDEDAAPPRGARACPTCQRTFPADFLVCPRDGAPLGVAANESDPLAGVLLAGSYRIERAIARGGMGRLYEATHTRLPRLVAVKVLHEPHARKKDAVRRFEREASVLARIDSPHVLPVLDFVRTPDGRGAIVTPLLDGEDLQSRLERDRHLSVRDAARIAHAMCLGLEAAHAEGIVHRDLKPSNVFLTAGHDDEPVVKLLDFGVAKLGEEDMTRTGVVLGTPAYMAPEQASGASRVDERADVYGVGAVLYRMLGGRMPYEAEDASQTLAKLLAGAPRRLSQLRPVPRAMEHVVQRAMAREPEERFASVAALAEALAPFLDRTTNPPKSTRRERAPTAPEVRIASTVATLGAAAAGGAAAAALTWSIASAIGTESESAAAFSLALALVGTVAGSGVVGWRETSELRRRWENLAELESHTRRLRASLSSGLAIVGAVELVGLATRSSAPAVSIGGVVAGVLTSWFVARRPPRSAS